MFATLKTSKSAGKRVSVKVIKLSGQIEAEAVEKAIERSNLLDEQVLLAVRTIINTVKESGDAAVAEYTREFDGSSIPTGQFSVSSDEINSAYNQVDKDFIEALRAALRNLKQFYDKTKIDSVCVEKEGMKVEDRIIPLSRVGIYVPGGRFPYPSTVLMNAVPAKSAGVGEIIMCSPPSENGQIHPSILVAAREVGVDRIFKIGGAQAIAAMAYGTDNVPRVDKITGPGNIYVMMAKREVFGQVGIDMLAGPSEVLIIADETAKDEFIAQDMLAQAEHDPNAQSILVTTSKELISGVTGLTEDNDLSSNMKAIVVDTIDKAIDVANIVAPEHLEIMTENAKSLVPRIKNAGAVFVGSYSPTAVGDYVAGPNHTLPTGGTARFSSPLSVYDFVKHSSVVYYSAGGLKDVSKVVETLAEMEGLLYHARSIKVRVNDDV